MESYIIYAAARIALLFFMLVPRAIGRRILNILGGLAYYWGVRYRHIAQVNLRIAFPGLCARERNRIARRSFQNAAQNLLEVSRLSSLTKEDISSLVVYDKENGMNNFEAAKAIGKPLLYLTGHFSAWELLPTAHALYGHPLSFVTRPLDNAPLERYLHRTRECAGNTVISKKNAARQILETLKSSGDVGILMDHNTITLEGIFCDFFGLPAPTTTAVALFALRTDATVLAGYLTPMQQGQYRIKFLPPLELVRTGDMSHDVQENTRRFNRVLESIIREQPESWLWGHKRWKYQPAGNPPDIYRLSPDELISFLASKRKSGDQQEQQHS